MSDKADNVIVNVQKLLDDEQSGCTLCHATIFRVGKHLREMNGRAFDPEITAIGPIHHDKDQLKDMEQHKVRCLRKLLQRQNGLSMKKCVIELRELEKRARQCYEKSIKIDSDAFVQMLLLDGVFVIELVRKYWFDNLRDKHDDIFQFDQVLGRLRNDLLLLENQLPFFVLERLFELTRMEDPDDNLHNLILFFVDDMFPCSNVSKVNSRFADDSFDHILALVYKTCFTYLSFDVRKDIPSHHEGNFIGDINSISELKHAGIKLKMAEGNTIWDFKFKKGVLELPHMNVSDKTESLLRNLIAYEQALSNDHPKYVTDYAFFMHCLVSCRKDVKILRRARIISNWLGDDETVFHVIRILLLGDLPGCE